MSADLTNDDSVKESSHTSENKIRLDHEGNQISLTDLENIPAKNVLESEHGTMKINVSELIPAEDNLLNNEMDLSQSENIHSVESVSGEEHASVDLYNGNDDKLNYSRKLIIDKANVNSEIVDLSLKSISTKDHGKANEIQENIDNRESETRGNQSIDANVYRENFCMVNNSCEIYDSIKSCIDAILDKANVNSEIVDLSLKSISTKDHGKANEIQENIDNRESETRGNQSTDANVYRENFCMVNNSCEIFDSIKSCIDAILDNVCLTEKGNESINIDFVVKHKEKLEALSQELSILNISPVKRLVKKGVNCDVLEMNHVLSSKEISQNFIKQQNTEISKPEKRVMDTSCNPEKDNFQSMLVDIVMKAISIDSVKSDERGIVEPVTQEYENSEANVKRESNFISDCKGAAKINDDVVSCVDMAIENFNLTKEKTELINEDFVPSNRETLEEMDHELRKLVKSHQKDQMKADNYDTFVISSEDKQGNFIEPLKTEISNSNEQNIHKCCNLQKGNCYSMNVGIVLKDISEDNGGVDKRCIAELENYEYENREGNICSGDSCFIEVNKEATKLSNDVTSCVDTILEYLSLPEEKVELINDIYSERNSEKSQQINQELSKLGRSLKEDQIKGDNYNEFRVNHGINSEEKQENFIKLLNKEINNSGKQNIYGCCNLEKDNFHSMNVNIDMKGVSEDRGKTNERSVTEPESQEHEKRENNINSGNNYFINTYKEVTQINNDVKLCVDMFLESLTKEKVELINENFTASIGEKSGEISQQLGNLVTSPQENQIKENNCDASEENLIKPLKTEINISGNKDDSFLENNNLHSMDGDVVMTDIFEDNEKGKMDSCDVTKPETQEHEKGALNFNNVASSFINNYTEIAEINSDIRSCSDKIPENLNLTEKDIEISDDFTVSSTVEMEEEDRQELSKLGRSFQKSQLEGDNSCDISSDAMCKLLDTEINSCSIDVNSQGISTKDFEKANDAERGIDELEVEAHEQHNTEDHINNDKSSVFISNGEVVGTSDVIKLSYPHLEIPGLTENGSERINIDLVISNSKKSENISQELSKSGRSLPDDLGKVQNSDLFGVNHVINSEFSFNKPLDEGTNSTRVQSNDLYSYSKKDFNSDSIDTSFKYVSINDCEKADYIGGTDKVNTEAHKPDIEVSICRDKSSVINSNLKIRDESDDTKLSDPLLGIATLMEHEKECTNLDFNANDNEKSEIITKESRLGKNLPNNQMLENNCDTNLDINLSKRFKTEITDSPAQSIDSYGNLEKDNSIDVTSGDLSTKNCRKTGRISRAIDHVENETLEQQTIEGRTCCTKSSVINSYERVGVKSNDTKSSLSLTEIASSTEKENELIHVDFIANSEKTEAVCQELSTTRESTQKDPMKKDNNYIAFGRNHASSPEEKYKDFDNALNINTNNLCKQSTDECHNPEKEHFDSIVEVNLTTTSLKDQGRSSQADNNINNAAFKTLKPQSTKASISSESNCLPIVDRDGEISGEITPLKSKNTTTHEESEVIIIFDNGDEHFDYEALNENSNNFVGKKNIDAQSQEKFNEEFDNKLKILKAQYADIESTLVTASESFSLETIYKFIAKIKKELTSCVQSSENLRMRFRNKWLRKLETSNERATPSCSYKQHPLKAFKTPVDNYRYRSQACTKLHTTIANKKRLYQKIESHHFYEYNSEMCPRERVQASHRCKQSPEHFTSSENETCGNLHKKKCKSSHYSYEHRFQRFNEDKGLGKCCLSKSSSYSSETNGGRSERDAKHVYSAKQGGHTKVGGLSKSSFAHKELKNPRNYIPYSSYSSPVRRLSSSNENYPILKPHSSRKKIVEGRKRKDFKSPKYNREYDSITDSTDSSEIFSDSDRESTPIHSDSYHTFSTYCNKTPKWIKKEKISSENERSRKRKYKRDTNSSYNSDSSVQEMEVPFEKRRHKEIAYEWNKETKRVQGLINRQMDYINKHVSKKDDLVKYSKSAFIPSNVAEKGKRLKYSNKQKFSDDEISSANDMPSVYENKKKRKKNASEPIAAPYKLAKISRHTDVHNILKNKYNSENSDAKLRSRFVSSSPHSPVSSEEMDRRTGYNKRKTRNSVDENIFENKYNIKSCTAQLQSDVVSPSRTLISPDKSRRRRNNKEVDCPSKKTLRDPVQEYNEIKMRNIDNRRCDKIWNDAVQRSTNENNEESSENEINNVKDMPSFVSFLKKKRGNRTNMERLLQNPIDEILPKSIANEEPYTDTHQESKHRVSCNEQIGTKTKLKHRSQAIDLMYPENSPGEAKKTVRMPKIYSEMSEQRLNERSGKEKPAALMHMSSEDIEKSRIEKPAKKYVRISPFPSEKAEQSFVKNPTKKKFARISPISSKGTEQDFIEKPKKSARIYPFSPEIAEQSSIEKPAKTKSVRISPISWEVTKKSLIEEPMTKKPAGLPQIIPKVTEKSPIKKPARKQPVEDKDFPVSNSSLDLFKQLNREIRKKKVTKSPASSKASTSAAD